MILGNVVVGGKLSSVTVEDGKIVSVADCAGQYDFDGEGLTLIPGLIDIHTHGFMGRDTMDADFEQMCVSYARMGTTSFLPTTMTLGREELLRVCKAKTDYRGANILGIHLEGPYIADSHKGAQNPAFIRPASMEEFSSLPNVRMITVAPETEGMMEFIREASGRAVISIGHTGCDYETAIRAIDAGASCLTHTFNAMTPFSHRAPGPIGAGCERHIYAQLIADGFHISRAAVIAAYRMFGADRLILISDSIPPAGLPDGEYASGGLSVTVKNRSIYIKDTETIAGSYACLLDCVRYAVSIGIPISDAVAMASEVPAELLGVKKGKIAAGYDADLLLVDKELNLKAVMIRGEFFS